MMSDKGEGDKDNMNKNGNVYDMMDNEKNEEVNYIINEVDSSNDCKNELIKMNYDNNNNDNNNNNNNNNNNDISYNVLNSNSVDTKNMENSCKNYVYDKDIENRDTYDNSNNKSNKSDDVDNKTGDISMNKNKLVNTNIYNSEENIYPCTYNTVVENNAYLKNIDIINTIENVEDNNMKNDVCNENNNIINNLYVDNDNWEKKNYVGLTEKLNCLKLEKTNEILEFNKTLDTSKDTQDINVVNEKLSVESNKNNVISNMNNIDSIDNINKMDNIDCIDNMNNIEKQSRKRKKNKLSDKKNLLNNEEYDNKENYDNLHVGNNYINTKDEINKVIQNINLLKALNTNDQKVNELNMDILNKSNEHNDNNEISKQLLDNIILLNSLSKYMNKDDINKQAKEKMKNRISKKKMTLEGTQLCKINKEQNDNMLNENNNIDDDNNDQHSKLSDYDNNMMNPHGVLNNSSGEIISSNCSNHLNYNNNDNNNDNNNNNNIIINKDVCNNKKNKKNSKKQTILCAKNNKGILENEDNKQLNDIRNKIYELTTNNYNSLNEANNENLQKKILLASGLLSSTDIMNPTDSEANNPLYNNFDKDTLLLINQMKDEEKHVLRNYLMNDANNKIGMGTRIVSKRKKQGSNLVNSNNNMNNLNDLNNNYEMKHNREYVGDNNVTTSNDNMNNNNNINISKKKKKNKQYHG
ncbi:hypothetical protein PFAG_04062 [Plasmodium falciparum Santa Lucia]|uniref:Uncharacterized protein n=1 Tax=Plasmodium falciparum Santa Lucia TaxID=478859 RepID=W7FNE6_PLAFA|nr:hypothetical protein PFAG_06052 [Plasmodium falciparum Santa Lucia]EUT82214.1 hypothetical protein PFAG_04062 [Plasmodium falciparum Santa Lucia]